MNFFSTVPFSAAFNAMLLKACGDRRKPRFAASGKVNRQAQRFSSPQNFLVRQRNAAEHGEKRKKLNEETRLRIIKRRKKSKTRQHDECCKHHEHAPRPLRGAPQSPCTA